MPKETIKKPLGVTVSVAINCERYAIKASQFIFTSTGSIVMVLLENKPARLLLIQ